MSRNPGWRSTLPENTRRVSTRRDSRNRTSSSRDTPPRTVTGKPNQAGSAAGGQRGSSRRSSKRGRPSYGGRKFARLRAEREGTFLRWATPQEAYMTEHYRLWPELWSKDMY